jgi:uncharacterized membrane protein YdjX (TVP38/TMEM64 family)
MKAGPRTGDAGPRTTAKRLAAAVVLAVIAWAIWSYASGGLMRVLLTASSGGGTLEALRAYVQGWGALAPVIYVAAVTVEVLIAPIPGLLLYAPGGAIFGGFLGGTLALIGNTLGATIASFLARTLGASWVAHHVHSPRFAAIRDRLRARGAWVVFVLRLNPLTSSDLVSYAAGLAGVPSRRVALGTCFGMLPQCYLQAYLAETLFEVLPLPVIIAGACLVVLVVGWMLWRADLSQNREPVDQNREP